MFSTEESSDEFVPKDSLGFTFYESSFHAWQVTRGEVRILKGLRRFKMYFYIENWSILKFRAFVYNCV